MIDLYVPVNLLIFAFIVFNQFFVNKIILKLIKMGEATFSTNEKSVIRYHLRASILCECESLNVFYSEDAAGEKSFKKCCLV